MPLGQFQLYDIIADTTPGITMIILWMPLLDVELGPVLGAGAGLFLIIVLGGYVIGRGLHGVTGVVEAAIDWDNLQYSWLYCVRPELIEENPENQKQALKKLTDSYLRESGFIGSFELNDKDFAHSLVYRQRTLYAKYNMLSTFYRNLILVGLASALGYIVTVVELYRIHTSITPQIVAFSFIAFVLVQASILATNRFFTFSIRRRNALIHDYHIELKNRYQENYFERLDFHIAAFT